MIVGLVSTYREGRLAEDAVRSLLSCCQHVIVADGPIGDNPPAGVETDWKVFRKDQRVAVHDFASFTSGKSWLTDADKRTWLLEKTRRYPAPVWGIILDGDELLLYGEQIPALIEHHEQEARANEGTSLGATMRIVEGDGTCGVITARILRLDLIERWLISSYHLLLKNGQEVSKPNGYFLKAGEPDTDRIETTTGMQIRRPLQGEPHILHRSFLRPPQRSAERQSAAEATAFDELVRDAGLGELHGERPADERPAIWLPR